MFCFLHPTPRAAAEVTETGINPHYYIFQKGKGATLYAISTTPKWNSSLHRRKYYTEANKDKASRYLRSETLSHRSTAKRLGKRKRKNKKPSVAILRCSNQWHNRVFPLYTLQKAVLKQALYKIHLLKKSENPLAVSVGVWEKATGNKPPGIPWSRHDACSKAAI